VSLRRELVAEAATSAMLRSRREGRSERARACCCRKAEAKE
jgi:hypothetical protein